MGSSARPWEWSNLWRTTYSPEGAVVVGTFALAVGLTFVGATLLFGWGIPMPGLDPQWTSYVAAAGFVLLGVLGVRLGVRQHRRGDYPLPPRARIR